MAQPLLTEEEFQEAIAKLTITQRTYDIAHGVLVEGRTQTEFVELFGLTRSAVSQAVARVRKAAATQPQPYAGPIPEGYDFVAAVLPSYRAQIVRRWSAEAEEAINRSHAHHEDNRRGKPKGRGG
jgi:hypothetical protein